MGKIDYQMFLKRKAEVKDVEVTTNYKFEKFEEEIKKFLIPTGLSNSSLAEQLREKILKVG
jgi:NDP-sugar pyrophosphorylase family protein